MASPFPGMDLYLEGEMWQEFHERLANQISMQLMPQIAPKYVALLAKRYVVNRPALGIFDLPPSHAIYPDVHIVEPPGLRIAERSAGALLVDELTTEVLNDIEAPQLSIEVRDVAQRRLVTIIEILSPANKYGEGRFEYSSRRRELLHTDAHLLEIDLLRQGVRVLDDEDLPQAHYYVYLSRSNRRHALTQIWAIDLRSRLPRVPVPLLTPDPDAVLDLQGAVRACFDLVGYERLLDYGAPPPPPELDAAVREWVEEMVRGGEMRG
jgi:Protein of unknown function (DUF4058)